MAGMVQERKRNRLGSLLVGIALLIGLPICLIATAVFEEVVFGSQNITDLHKEIGIYEPLEWLVDNTLGRFF
jgi:hypothetical protein